MRHTSKRIMESYANINVLKLVLVVFGMSAGVGAWSRGGARLQPLSQHPDSRPASTNRRSLLNNGGCLLLQLVSVQQESCHEGRNNSRDSCRSKKCAES